MKIVIDPLYLRRPKLNYISPAVCEAIFSGTGSPIIILSDIGKLPGPTGLVLGGGGSRRLSWDRYPGALCYNVYTAVFDVHSVFECEELVNQSLNVTYEILFECLIEPFVIVPSAGCYRVSAITPDGESDLSDPACICRGDPPFFPVTVCNQEQTATCTPPLVGAPVTIAAGEYCIDVEDDAEAIAAAQAQMNEQAMAQAESELICSGGGGGNQFAYYKMDEGSGVRVDTVGARNLSELNGAVTSNTGIISLAGEFFGPASGQPCLISAATDFAFPADFSISLWLFPIGVGGDAGARILSTTDPTETVSGQLVFASNVTGGPFGLVVVYDAAMVGTTMLFGLTPSVWNHYVVTWKASTGTLSVYLDGILNAQLSGLPPLNMTGNRLAIGGTEIERCTRGMIDEVGIWTRELTAAEALTLYNGGTGLAFGSPGFPG